MYEIINFSDTMSAKEEDERNKYMLFHLLYGNRTDLLETVRTTNEERRRKYRETYIKIRSPRIWQHCHITATK